MEADRNVELLGERKDRIVLRVVGVPFEHRARHGDRHEPELGDRAARLVERVGHRSQRERRRPLQPIGRGGAVRRQPVVVRTTAGDREIEIREGVEPERRRRVEHCDIDALFVHVDEPRVRIDRRRRASARPRGSPRAPTRHDRSRAGRGALRARSASCRGRRGRAGAGDRWNAGSRCSSQSESGSKTCPSTSMTRVMLVQPTSSGCRACDHPPDPVARG